MTKFVLIGALLLSGVVNAEIPYGIYNVNHGKCRIAVVPSKNDSILLAPIGCGNAVGFLTFKRIQTSRDDYQYQSGDQLLEPTRDGVLAIEDKSKETVDFLFKELTQSDKH